MVFSILRRKILFLNIKNLTDIMKPTKSGIYNISYIFLQLINKCI